MVVRLDDFGPFLNSRAAGTTRGIMPRQFRFCRRCLGAGLAVVKDLKMGYTVFARNRAGELKVVMLSATGHR